MEDLSLTPSRRLYAQQTYSRAANAFDAIAWRPPTGSRFDGRPANDVGPAPLRSGRVGHRSGWITAFAGSLVAALMGAVLGGLLQV